MKTYLANTGLEGAQFDAIAAALQIDDPHLVLLSALSRSPDKEPLGLIALVPYKADPNPAWKMATRNRLAGIDRAFREAGQIRKLRAITVLQCHEAPAKSPIPDVTAGLIETMSRLFPKRATLHYGLLEYRSDPPDLRVQSYRLYPNRGIEMAAPLLAQAVSACLVAGAISIDHDT